LLFFIYTLYFFFLLSLLPSYYHLFFCKWCSSLSTTHIQRKKKIQHKIGLSRGWWWLCLWFSFCSPIFTFPLWKHFGWFNCWEHIYEPNDMSLCHCLGDDGSHTHIWIIIFLFFFLYFWRWEIPSFSLFLEPSFTFHFPNKKNNQDQHNYNGARLGEWIMRHTNYWVRHLFFFRQAVNNVMDDMSPYRKTSISGL
jgi:hypothetical protein